MRFVIVGLLIALGLSGCIQKNSSDKTGEYHGEIGYNIWVKAFADSDNDNIGDFNGITSKLDYLHELGITMIKLSPILKAGFTSTSPCANTHGYDVVDYYNLNPQFGTEKDLKNLLSEAHKRGMKVIFDFIPNHSSNLHPWFIDSKNGGAKKDWYTWSDKPDTNWGFAWGGGNWDNVWFKADNNRYYYSAFSVSSLPDFNYRNPELVNEMLNIAKHWLDYGFDGLRVDAARYIWEDGPGEAADRPGTLDFFRKLRALTDSYKTEKIMIAEAWSNKDDIKAYYGNGNDIFHMCIDFPWAWFVGEATGKGRAKDLSNLMIAYRNEYPKNAEPASITNNHDHVSARNFSKYNNPQEAMLALAMTIFTKGVPFFYYGDEIGTKGELLDGLHQGFALRGNLDWKAVEKQKADPNSMLNWVTKFNHIRNSYPVISYGEFSVYEQGDDTILPILYYNNEEQVSIIYNCSDTVKSVTLTDNLSKDASVIIGDESKVKITETSFAISDIPAKSLVIIHDGKNKSENVAGSPVNVTGGADYKEFNCNEYENMYAVVNGKRHKMHKLPAGGWEYIAELPKGNHTWLFTNGEGITWGDNQPDGICEVDGKPVNFTMPKPGKYVLQFNHYGRHYLAFPRWY